MKELTFHQNGDYLIPDLEAPEAPRIGKYGTMRHQYLRDNHRGIFDGMLLNGTLNAHLEEIDRHANDMMERMTAHAKASPKLLKQATKWPGSQP